MYEWSILSIPIHIYICIYMLYKTTRIHGDFGKQFIKIPISHLSQIECHAQNRVVPYRL